MRIKWDCRVEEVAGHRRYLLHPGRAAWINTEPRASAAKQRGGSRRNGRPARRGVLEFHQLGGQRDRPGGCWRGGAGSDSVLANRPGLRTLAFCCRSLARGFGPHAAPRVLDHERNRRCHLAEIEKGRQHGSPLRSFFPIAFQAACPTLSDFSIPLLAGSKASDHYGGTTTIERHYFRAACAG